MYGKGDSMEVITKNIDELIPYEKNPRKNDKAVKYVAESIKNFGFQSPIIVDKDNVIICGHTRLKAAIKLGIKEVPVVVAENLSEEQVKAFRLADNKVSEKADWDFDLLDAEINEIFDIDMGDFGFEFEEAAEPKPKKNERLRTDEAYNLPYVDIDPQKAFIRCQ